VEKFGKARQAREDNKVWSMRITCWIGKVTDTQLEYATLIVFPLEQWLCERASILCYMCIASLILSSCIPFIVLYVFHSFLPVFFIFTFLLYFLIKYICAITPRPCPLLKLVTQVTNFLEAWYKHNIIRSYCKVALFIS
jgi:hypothetical protein